MKQIPFVCDMSVFDLPERANHIEKIKSIFQLVKEIKEIANGYIFLLPDKENTLENLASFIEKERLCCPFFSFTVEVKSGSKNLVLKITGRDGVKKFIRAEFDNILSTGILWSK